MLIEVLGGTSEGGIESGGNGRRGNEVKSSRGKDVGEDVFLILSEILLGQLTERVGVRLVSLAEEREDVRLKGEKQISGDFRLRRGRSSPGCRERR